MELNNVELNLLMNGLRALNEKQTTLEESSQIINLYGKLFEKANADAQES